VIAAGAAVSPLDASVDQWAVANRNDGVFHVLEPIREGGVAFSGKTITSVALGVLAVGLATRNQTLQDGLFGCATAYAASSVVRTFVVYPLVARTRPDSSGGSVPTPAARQGDQYHFSFPGTSDWGRHAFPGGHLANITSCVAFLTQRYSTHYVRPVPWAAVGALTVARTLDRAHGLSDEVVGGLFGYAVGKEVAIHARRRAKKRRASARAGGFFLTPMTRGVGLGWRAVF
jgi:membrane-associated phospholipid phosphatase